MAVTAPDDQLPRDAEPAMPPEHRRYIRALRIWTRVSLLLLVTAFVLLVVGKPPPAVPLDELPRTWSLSADEFVRQARMPSGWQWTARLHQSDVLSIVPAVFLASVTGLCLLSILPIFIRRRDVVFVVLILLQLAVFVLAALPGGGH